MTHQIELELSGVARWQLEELLEALPATPFTVEIDTLALSRESLGELYGMPIHSVCLSARWTDTLGHALSLDLQDLTAAKLRYFLEELAGDSEIYPQIFLQREDWEILEIKVPSAKLVIEWEDRVGLDGPIDPLDLDEEEDWSGEVGHWVQELEAEASRTEDPELRAAHRRQIGLLLGLAEYAARYEDLDH